MKNERITWGLAFASILLQWYFMYTSDAFEVALPFSTGLLSADTMGGNITQILFTIIPIPFLLWLFSGRMEGITRGYGKVFIIRNYSRKKLLLKETGKMVVTVTLLQCFVWALFQGFPHDDWVALPVMQQARVMLLYMLALIGVVLLQYCLELVVSQIYAQITTLVYYAVSLFSYGIVQDTGIRAVTKGVFFPNLGFAMRNGAVETGNVEPFLSSVTEMLLICTLLMYISLKIVSKKDMM